MPVIAMRRSSDVPSKRDPEKGPVTVFLRRPRIAAARERLDADGRDMTELVGHALDEYAAGRLTLPPPRSAEPREHDAPAPTPARPRP